MLNCIFPQICLKFGKSLLAKTEWWKVPKQFTLLLNGSQAQDCVRVKTVNFSLNNSLKVAETLNGQL